MARMDEMNAEMDRAKNAQTSAQEELRMDGLDALLEAGRVPVREGFHARVMASLPSAGWEAARRPARSAAFWRWPVAVLAALVALTRALVGMSSTQLAPGGSFLGALAALADLFASSALAGAGLLGASWQGIGLVTSEILGEIPGGLVAFAVLVVCLNLLLLSLVRRRSARVSSDVGTSAGGDGTR
jgi:hypothetical protein